MWSVPAQIDTSPAYYLRVAHASTVDSAGWTLGTVFYGGGMQLFQPISDNVLKPRAQFTGSGFIG